MQKELENNAFPSEKDREMIIIRLEEIKEEKELMKLQEIRKKEMQEEEKQKVEKRKMERRQELQNKYGKKIISIRQKKRK